MGGEHKLRNLKARDLTMKKTIREYSCLVQFYAPQTKIWEGGTRDEMRMFDALFNG